jgi:hypothetical protein
MRIDSVVELIREMWEGGPENEVDSSIKKQHFLDSIPYSVPSQSQYSSQNNGSRLFVYSFALNQSTTALVYEEPGTLMVLE